MKQSLHPHPSISTKGRSYWLLWLLLILPWLAQAQCPTGDVTLSSQAAVNAFPPGCVNFPGRLTIKGDDITDLRPLAKLQTVGSDLQIVSNGTLTSLQGLGSLTRVYNLVIDNNAQLTSLASLTALTQTGNYLEITNNGSLTSLQGLESLTRVGHSVLITNNTKLTNLAGLTALTQIGFDLQIEDNRALTSLQGLGRLTSIPGNLSISDNAQLTSLASLTALTQTGQSVLIINNGSLTSLQGLSNLTHVGGSLAISNNAQLTSLAALTKLTQIGDDLDILNNPVLSACAIPPICQYLTSPNGRITISGNAPGCQSRQDVQADCFPLSITQQPASSSVVCIATPVSTSVGVAGNARFYQWYQNGTALTSQTSATLTLPSPTTADAGRYVVVISNSVTSLTSTAFNLTVNASSVSLSNNGPLTCTQTSVALSASGTTGATYAFRGVNGAIASSGNTASVSSPGTYTVTASLNGCSSTTTTTVGSNTTPPTVSISPSATAICAGQSVTLNANAMTSGGTLSYRWNTNATTHSISVSATGPYSVSVIRSDNGCVATATASVTVNPLPTPNILGLASAYCQNAGQQPLAGSPSGGVFTVDGSSATSFNPAGLTIGQHTVVYSYTNTSGCSNTTAQTVTIKEVPPAPTLVTASGYPYPAGQSRLTTSQNVGPVSLTVLGCSGGMLMANGNAASSFTITTAMTGTQTYTATCTSNGCTSLAGSFQLTVLPTTLSVLHRDADYGNTQNNVIKPYLELANAGGQAIPYSEVTVRYWFTTEGQAPPTNLAVYYAQLGAVSMSYVPLNQPRQGAFGYVEYSFPGGGEPGRGRQLGTHPERHPENRWQ
ncbi:cellulose binding domain-containing protein [Spirosoma foliorum]|uniref:Ig-like domain-containing protein n=1 Tax=Spirosoma foliorum TaxID=2710596 RepID=A0A7G5H1D9_9BACT|nr:cellulose binding domain-containing protein [Spirosoma foliorum]QMW04931.1 hypothetical protein H3H32_08545 [Spirosoma foliorum]